MRFLSGLVLILMCSVFGCSTDTRSRSAAVPPSPTPTPTPTHVPTENPPVSPQMVEITDGANRFALDLYQQLRSESGNLFFSPASISIALAMTSAGAAGQTRMEIVETLHFPTSGDSLNAGMKALLAAWSTDDPKTGIRLNLANRLWGQDGATFVPAFLDVTREAYGAELTRLDYNRGEESRQVINAWVTERTNGKITDLIPPGVLTADTKLVLTNAIYFHGLWRSPFDPKETHDGPFHPTAGDSVMVPMMHASGAFRCAAMDQLKVLELPYGDGSLSMFILLPDRVDGLADLEERLSFTNVQRWVESVRHEGAAFVEIPRFRTTSEFELSGVLGAMGMPAAFNRSSADFSGMTGARDLFLSAVIHKAFVDVNEEGTEAAAATGAEMTVTGFHEPPEPFLFYADHPFVFLIRDNRHKAILFLGRLTNPLK